MIKKIITTTTIFSALYLAGCAAPVSSTAPVVDNSLSSTLNNQQTAQQNVQVGVVNTGQPLNTTIYNPNAQQLTNGQLNQPANYQDPVFVEPVAPVAVAPVNNAPSAVRDTLGEQQQQGQALASLYDKAADAVGSGNLDQAAGALEQALRIEPNNASTWHDLGQVRMHQNQYDQAVAMAQKSISFAGNNNSLKSRNWRLIAVANRAQGNEGGAAEAEARAAAFE